MEELYSSNLKIFDGNIENPALRDSLRQICSYLNITEPHLYEWGEGRIALAVYITVNLPSLRNHENIDIRSVEPVLIVFNLEKYPSISPIVFTDRLSFPKNDLAHLYIAKNGRPPAFCLVRENSEDWYAKKRPVDLVKRISNWLQDAATGNLSLNGEQFDPLRLENYTGILIYDYNIFAEVVNKKEGFSHGSNFAVILFKRTADSTYKFVKFITEENYTETIKEVAEAREKKSKDIETTHYHIGYLVWNNEEDSYNQYIINTPSNWDDLKNHANLYGIDLSLVEKYLSESDKNYFKGVPIILAIKRPLNVIGYRDNIEFSNHVIILDDGDKKDGKIINNISVLLFSHNQILNQDKAQTISGEDDIVIGKSLIIGCGALGSKIIMHLARSGQRNFVLTDGDKISPHNLVRHALLGEHLGMNKAIALSTAIKEIFPDQKVEILSLPINFTASDYNDVFDKFTWIFDFTASENVFNSLICDTNVSTRVCRAYISDNGNLGLMFIEGKDRNPRIDDLQAYLYSISRNTDWVSEWLNRERNSTEQNLTNISVGVGCNSETTILADDIISAHAAHFSRIVKQKNIKEQTDGTIYVYRIINDEDGYNVRTQTIFVPSFIVIPAKNDPSWSIRLTEGITDRILEATSQAGTNETGGVFIGFVNYKSKVIYVVDLIDAPPDSSANAVCFHRGYKGLSQSIEEITKKSGNQLGYIGEWHSHPHGPNCLSSTDQETIDKYKVEFNNLLTPIPVFIIIVAPEGILPYVFTS